MAAILNNVKLMQETSVVHPHRTTAYHGETVNFSIDFRSYGAQVDLTGAAAALYWRVPSDEEGYWHQATASCTGSTAAWTWDATMDNGQSPVTWFLKVDADDSNDTTSYRATGELTLLASPGFVPAVVPPARITLDFDYIDVLHAPYYTKAETDTALGAKYDKAGGDISGDARITGGHVLKVSNTAAVLDDRREVDVTPTGFVKKAGRVDRSIALPMRDGTIALQADVDAKLNADNGTTALSLNDDIPGLRVGVSDDVGYAEYRYTSIVHNPGGADEYTLTLPEKDGVLAITGDVAAKLDKNGGITVLSLEGDDAAGFVAAGLVVGDTAGVYHASYRPNEIVHNVPDSVDHVLQFPFTSGTLATEEYVGTAIANAVGTINSALDTINGEVI